MEVIDTVLLMGISSLARGLKVAEDTSLTVTESSLAASSVAPQVPAAATQHTSPAAAAAEAEAEAAECQLQVPSAPSSHLAAPHKLCGNILRHVGNVCGSTADAGNPVDDGMSRTHM
jgi:hypothetical protein